MYGLKVLTVLSYLSQWSYSYRYNIHACNCYHLLIVNFSWVARLNVLTCHQTSWAMQIAKPQKRKKERTVQNLHSPRGKCTIIILMSCVHGHLHQKSALESVTGAAASLRCHRASLWFMAWSSFHADLGCEKNHPDTGMPVQVASQTKLPKHNFKKYQQKDLVEKVSTHLKNIN